MKTTMKIIIILFSFVSMMLLHSSLVAQQLGCGGHLGIVLKGPIIVELDNNDIIRGRVLANRQQTQVDGSTETIVTLLLWDSLRKAEIPCRTIKRFYKDTLPKEVLGATITGRVLGLDGRPTMAQIHVENIDTIEQLTGRYIKKTDLGMVSTDSNGFYRFMLPSGRYYGYYYDRVDAYPISMALDLTTPPEKPLVVTDDITLITFDEMIDRNIPVRMNNLFFDFAKAKLRSASFAELDRLALILKQYGFIAMIEGHTDNIGPLSSNDTLSVKRAKSVENYLIGQGLAPNKLLSIGYGSKKPRAGNDTPEGRAINRRVELRLKRPVASN
ncbi:MAG TPA: OmpA family protein [Candidatus Kapabacteria bacterium]|nr:OmpA family protein [Candidatus Kapabacteria bacterium]